MIIILKSKQSIIQSRKFSEEERIKGWRLIAFFCFVYRDEDEDETDTTSKSKEDVGPFGQPSSSSAHVLGDLLNSVTEEGPSNARNENQSRNGTVSEPGGHSTGNDVDEAFLNPMDIL